MPIKITPAIAATIRARNLPPRADRMEHGAAMRNLAAEFGIARETVRRIRLGMSWRNAFPHAKVTPAMLADILSQPNVKADAVAAEHGLSATTVYAIRTGDRLYARGYVA